MPFVVSIDGPKGAGKTTVAALVRARVPKAVVLSLDEIRRAIPDAIPTEEFNALAFKTLLQRVVEYVDQQKDVVVDSGLTEERSETLKEAIRDACGFWLPYALTASYDVLLKRVRQRDQLQKRHTNKERFERSFDRQQEKGFEGVTVFDTTELSPEEVADRIVEDMKAARVSLPASE